MAGPAGHTGGLMLTADELKSLKVGDEIDSGASIFEGLPDAECVVLVVTRTTAKLVEFDLIYFGITIGSYIAQHDESGKVLWVDQGKSRKASAKKRGMIH